MDQVYIDYASLNKKCFTLVVVHNYKSVVVGMMHGQSTVPHDKGISKFCNCGR